jgi:hypothetical protein
MATEETRDAMTFVANWIARQYDDELSVSSPYNELHNAFRSKYGRNALGLRNALQHYAKLGELEISKGNHASQTYTIAGAEIAPSSVEILPLQTDDHRIAAPVVASSVSVNVGEPPANDTKYPHYLPTLTQTLLHHTPPLSHIIHLRVTFKI